MPPTIFNCSLSYDPTHCLSYVTTNYSMTLLKNGEAILIENGGVVIRIPPEQMG